MEEHFGCQMRWAPDVTIETLGIMRTSCGNRSICRLIRQEIQVAENTTKVKQNGKTYSISLLQKEKNYLKMRKQKLRVGLFSFLYIFL